MPPQLGAPLGELDLGRARHAAAPAEPELDQRFAAVLGDRGDRRVRHVLAVVEAEVRERSAPLRHGDDARIRRLRAEGKRRQLLAVRANGL